YHKFLYMDENLDVVGCVGCGRCISGCPVNIDIIEVLEEVKEVTGNEC
ncbi:MAG: 4Fe-4S dicluster domain-containing protein, partial [Thermoplasmata archaeon]|nr:4Fe-4S dicluster domain-containing protein [Thermoplasmata archaeon]